VYNELIEDLADPSRVELTVVDDPLVGAIVPEATLQEVQGPQQLLEFILEVSGVLCESTSE